MEEEKEEEEKAKIEYDTIKKEQDLNRFIVFRMYY